MPTIFTTTSIQSTSILADTISNQAGTGAPSFANGMKLVDGAAATPAITFINSTGLGFFRKAADSLGISAAGLEVGSFTSAGAWTLGPVGLTTAHKVHGNSLTIQTTDASASSQLEWRRTTGGLGHFAMGINVGSGGPSDLAIYGYQNSVAGAIMSNAGAWTLGPAAAIGGTTYAGNNIVGRTNGSQVPVGYVGEVQRLFASAVAITASNSAQTLLTLTLSPGIWELSGWIQYSQASALTSIRTLSTISANLNDPAPIAAETQVDSTLGPTAAANISHPIVPYMVTITAPTPYRLNALINYSLGSATAAGMIRAIRIA